MGRRSLILVALVVACGGATSTSTSSGADGGPATNGAPAGTPPPSGTSLPPPSPPQKCPPTPATPDTSCTGYADCEYGGDAFGNCPQLVNCDQKSFAGPFVWIADASNPGCVALPPSCPATRAAVQEGTSCAPAEDVEAVCEYPEAACACVTCRAASGDAVGVWKCRAWDDVNKGCPVKPRAHLGAPCSTPDLRCDYNRCANEWGSDVSLSGPIGDLACTDGSWQFDLAGTPGKPDPTPCPSQLPACP